MNTPYIYTCIFPLLHSFPHTFLLGYQNRYDISKVPDVFDSAKFDLLHNTHLNLIGLEELYKTSRTLADCVIPCEYGNSQETRYRIGSVISKALVDKLLQDLLNAKEESLQDARAEYQSGAPAVHICAQ